MDDWDLYFSTIVGWSLHPGYLREGTTKMTLEECAELARQMVETKKSLKEAEKEAK